MNAMARMVPQSGESVDRTESPIIHHNPWLEPRGPALRRLATEIFNEIEQAGAGSDKRRPRKDAVERRRVAAGNLVASLAEIALRGNCESSVAVSARKEAATRYDRREIHRDVTTKAVKSLAEGGLLTLAVGQFLKSRTLIRPTAAFCERLAACGVTAADIGIASGGEPILLKARTGRRNEKVPVDYADTDEIERLRQEVERISETLNRADLRLDGVPMPPVFMQRIYQIENPNAPQVFNRHGRLWGGWWQTLKKERRGLISIDGEAICDLDFSACFLNLAYIRIGAPLPSGDPYALEGLVACHRPALKKAFSALLFRDGEKRPRLPEEIRSELPDGWTMPRLIDAFTAKHPAIAPLFGSGVGLEIMHTESEILVAALLELADQHIPALGMHDGLGLAVSKKDCGIAAMETASRRIAGVALPVTEKPLRVPDALTRP